MKKAELTILAYIFLNSLFQYIQGFFSQFRLNFTCLKFRCYLLNHCIWPYNVGSNLVTKQYAICIRFRNNSNLLTKFCLIGISNSTENDTDTHLNGEILLLSWLHSWQPSRNRFCRRVRFPEPGAELTDMTGYPICIVHVSIICATVSPSDILLTCVYKPTFPYECLLFFIY